MSRGDELLERDKDHHASNETKETTIDKGTKDVLEHKPAKKCSWREGEREREGGVRSMKGRERSEFREIEIQ